MALTAPIAVRPSSFSSAAEAFLQVHTDISRTLDALYVSLQSSGQMAGSDKSGREFAQTYDKTVNGEQSLLAGIALMGNACGKMAELLDASAVNHANVNNAIGLCTPANPSGNLKNLDTIPTLSVGTSFGGPGEPSNWEKLKEFIEGEVFPDGQPDKLEKAGDAWTRAATSLRTHQSAVRSAIKPIAGESSAEVGPAQDQAAMIDQHLGGIAESCDAVAKLCNGFADEVRKTREEIGNLVEELACELLVAAAIGIALVLVTSGLSSLLATAAGVAKAIQTGARIAGVIRALATAAGPVLRPVAYVLDPVAAAAGDLGALLGSRGAMFSMQLSKGSIRAAELAAALEKIPVWAHDELKRATDPDVLRKALEADGVPKNLIDDAIANNPYRNMTPQQILDRYWDDARGTWAYPPNNGFESGYKVADSIPAGTRLDRLGGDGGGFMGREGDSYSARALPPGKAGPYTEYVGTGNPLPANWEVRHGKIAEAFGQSGGGHQWVVVDKLTGKEVPVKKLIDADVIE
ncbi:TNT domain-containing protein [Gordonia amicalis]|uniref:glycohydrolase toxin TNT-related protein n=1 Tax=Gordonia amicalis TaxID=89053 RepID=UPI00200A4954|nr:glycohydrolase toxin TNT-related protein [Gordonia amicalis]UPW14560.1 TNT domain-containing protein [Gordonia amicalis]